MADNQGGFINISKEIRNTNVGGHAVAMDQVRDPASGGTTSLARVTADETRITSLEGSVSLNILEATTPKNTKFMIGGGGANFQADGNPDVSHFDDIFTIVLTGARSDTRLRGVMKFDRHIQNAGFPSQFYYFLDNNQLQPTTDGTNIATSNLSDFLGNASRLFSTTTERNELISDTSKAHTLTHPVNSIGLPLATVHQDADLEIIFNFSDFDVDVASFTGRIITHRNTGDKSTLFNTKTKATFNRVSAGSGRYTITLGTSVADDPNPIKVSDIFNKQTHTINLNTGGHTNQVQVNGETGFILPFFADSELLTEIYFDVDIDNS